jgi:ElaB/YqjD/DUF883 family membrane-anchored ribosome-binding protein
MASEPIPEPLPHQEVKAEQPVSLPPEGQLTPSSEVPRGAVGRQEMSKTQLHAAAESVGVALGQAVNAVRDLSRRTGEATEQSRRLAQEKVETVKDRVAEVSKEASRTTAETYERAKTRAAEAANEAKQTAARHLEEARARAQYIADEFPLQVIAATAGAAFLAGVMLRIWRSNREE